MNIDQDPEQPDWVNDMTSEQLKSGIQSALDEGWMNECPKTPGYYDFRCGETDFEVELVKVELNKGFLIAEMDSGTYPVDVWHYNLDNPQWRLRGAQMIGKTSHELAREILRKPNLPIRVIRPDLGEEDEIAQTREPVLITMTCFIGDESMIDGEYLLIDSKP